jgi:preprotein translocase subunit SecB
MGRIVPHQRLFGRDSVTTEACDKPQRLDDVRLALTVAADQNVDARFEVNLYVRVRAKVDEF